MAIFPKPVLKFEARSVWCVPEIDSNFYAIGFELTDIPEEDIAIIEQIIDDYGFWD